MTIIETMYTNRRIELKPCPFCGGATEIKWIGNDATKIRKVVIRCPSCRCQRTDSALKHGFEWMENVAVRNWNQRMKSAEEVEL